jgi:Flp pilus assembly protein TadG
MKATRRSEAGMAILETALALPVLLLVLFAIMELGLAFARFQVVLNAAREGARAATIFKSPCNPTSIQQAATDEINKFNDNRLGMRTIMMTGFQPSADGDACTARNITVTVQFVHEIPFTSGLAAIAGRTDRGPLTISITGRSTMPNERRRAI